MALRQVIAEGDIYAFRGGSSEGFNGVKLARFGHAICWLGNDGGGIDFGWDQLRRRAERQAEILRLGNA